ncbi:MAG: hypothetical protein RI957_495 [Verrucomicrobiota bacterium]|jgi:hypothetical protein
MNIKHIIKKEIIGQFTILALLCISSSSCSVKSNNPTAPSRNGASVTVTQNTKRNGTSPISTKKSLWGLFRSTNSNQSAMAISNDAANTAKISINHSNSTREKRENISKTSTPTNASTKVEDSQVVNKNGTAVQSKTLNKNENLPTAYETTKTLETTESFKPKISGN